MALAVGQLYKDAEWIGYANGDIVFDSGKFDIVGQNLVCFTVSYLFWFLECV